MLVMGLIGAFLTCAYMTRAIWYTFFGEPRGLSAEHEIHESGPRITVPLIILAGLAVIAGFANIPHSGVLDGVPTSIALQLRALRRAHRRLLPGCGRRGVPPPRVQHHASPSSRRRVALVGHRCSAYLWYWRGLGPHGITERNQLARSGYRVLENKYYLDWLYTDVIAAGVKGPIARASQLGQPERHRRRRQRRRAAAPSRSASGSTTTSTRAWSTPSSTGSGAAAEGSGQILRKFQTGKVQQYGAYLFLGATVLAAVFVFVSK